MFSSRFHWDLRPNALTGRLRARGEAGADLLDLTESNPTRAGIRYPAKEILDALADARSLRYEPAAAGLASAREAVAAVYYRRRVDPARILLTASTSEAYAYLIKLLTDPGDELLVPRPSYPLFEFLATMESVRVSTYPLLYDSGWSIDIEALAAAVTDRTRAVVLVNPNNPTGSFVKAPELAALVELCRKRGLAIVSDEVFSDYAFAPDPQRVESLIDEDEALTFCLSGLSKVAGLPQMKLGWIVSGGPSAERMQAMERLELIADIGALQVEGGWFATVQMPRIRTSEEWALTLLDRCDVLVQPGYFYDFDQEALLVLSLLTPTEIFQEGLRRLK